MSGEELRAALLDEMSTEWTTVERAIWPDGPASGHGSGAYAVLKAKIIAFLAAPSTPEPSWCAACERGDRDTHTQHVLRGKVAPSTEPALDREAVVRAVHDWFCGESVNHGDRRRPISGWVCERGADAILARLAESQP